MAITKNLVVTLKNDIAKPKEKMFVYRDDVGIEMVIELKDFNYSIDAVENRNNIQKAYALFRTPANKTYQYTNIKISDGKLVFTFSQDIVNVMQEIGEYELQFQLYDKENNRLTIPSYNFYVKEPLTIDGELVDTAVVDESIIAGFGEEQDYIFVITDGYIKTEWKTGDLITKERLNKVENALSVITDAVNSKAEISQLHNHENKEILDTISANKINEWDNKSNFNGDYNNLTNKPTIPTKVSDLLNDSGYLTEHQDISGKVDKVDGKSLISDDEIERLATLKNYDDTNINLQLNDIESEINELKEGNINLSNYVTKDELSEKADKTELHSHNNKSVLDGITSNKIIEWDNKSVFSGNYNDLTNKPTIPTKVSQLTNDEGYLTSIPNDYITDSELNAKGYLTEHQDISHKADKTELHSHSNKNVLDGITTSKITEWDNKSTFDGNYNSLTNKPTIPTKTSQLTNDSGFITTVPSEYITETELNAKGYLTQHQDISHKVDKISGYSLVSDTEISRLATLENYDDTEVRELIDEANMSLEESVKFEVVGEGITVPPNEYVTETELNITINENILSLKKEHYITPQMYGAKADGVTDDSIAIQNAIKNLPKDGGVLYFPSGTYIHGDGTTTGLSYEIDTKYPEGHAYYPCPLLVPGDKTSADVGRDIRFILDGFRNLTIIGNGAIIQSHINNGETRNNGLFKISNCENLIIDGLTIDAKREERGIKFTDYDPGLDMGRSNIAIEKCNRVIIRNVKSINGAMDGLSLASDGQAIGNKDVLIEKCIFNNNHRQGISIEGATNVTVRNTECSLNGTGKGIMPKSGIDVEAYGNTSDGGTYGFNNNITIEKCYFDSNGYQNITVNNQSYNTIIKECVLKNAYVNAQVGNSAKLINNKIIDCKISTGFQLIAYNDILYGRDGFIINTNDVNPNCCAVIEHNTFDLTPSVTVTNNFSNILYIVGKEIFRYNHVKNAISSSGSAYSSSHFSCIEVTNNTFELTSTVFDGQNVKTTLNFSKSDKLKRYGDNYLIGYTHTSNDASDKNNYFRTDYSLTKSVNSNTLDISKIYKLPAYDGIMNIRVVYLEQEEEIILCKKGGYSYHNILRRARDLGSVQLVNLYKDANYFYIKYTYSNTNTEVKMAYSFPNTTINNYIYKQPLEVTSLSATSLTKINPTETTLLTTSLKANYDKAYTHSTSTHAPTNAQKNSDITKAEIEAKLTGTVSSHDHSQYITNNWGSENAGKVLMVGSDGRLSLYDLADFDPNAQVFNLTQNYTNVSSDVTLRKIKETLPLTLQLTTTNGKDMGNVIVTMGGVDITSDVYAKGKTTGTINIPAVTGDIVIQATALNYTNLAEINRTNTTDETIWINNAEMNVNGTVNKNRRGYVLTNYIPVKHWDVVRVKGLIFGEYHDLNIYKANKEWWYTQDVETVLNNSFIRELNTEAEYENGYLTFRVGHYENGDLGIKYIRMGATLQSSLDDVIITVNEEIN